MNRAKKIEWIDSFKGIGIILVILGHLNNIPLWMETYIYSFHMPLFFFISGYLLNFNKQTSIKDYIKKKAIALLIPYIFFALLSLSFDVLKLKLQGISINLLDKTFEFLYLKGNVGWNSPIWFLLCLFIVEVIVFLLLKKNRKLSYLVIAISCILGYFFMFYSVRLPFGLDIAVVVIPFFIIGNIIKEKKIVEKLNSGILIRIISMVVFLATNILFGNILNIRISVYHFEFGNLFYFYISAIAGIMFLASVAYTIQKSKILEYYGENSLLIFATQYFVFNVYRIIGQKIMHNNFMEVQSLAIGLLVTLNIMILYIPVIWSVNKFIPMVVGGKKYK